MTYANASNTISIFEVDCVAESDTELPNDIINSDVQIEFSSALGKYWAQMLDTKVSNKMD
jgi:hypothetical protein